MQHAKRLASALGVSLPPRSPSEGAALLISAVGSPFLTPLYTASAIVRTWAQSLSEFLVWISLICILFIGVGFGYVLIQTLRGKISDVHVSEPSQRQGPFTVAVCSSIVGIFALWWIGVPGPLIALGTSFALQGIIFGLLTRWAKISMHVAVAASCITTLVWLFGWVAVPLMGFLPLQGWARMRRGRHTFAQVILGAGLAPVLTLAMLLSWSAIGGGG